MIEILVGVRAGSFSIRQCHIREIFSRSTTTPPVS